jgi:16S rRNA (guanine527-N7)-methyltransferase
MDIIKANKLRQQFLLNGIELTDEQVEQFLLYYEMLIQWNEVMNLTAITEFDEVLIKHFIDSTAIHQIVDMNKVQKMIDVGTGAGFPGIPLKIIYPDMEITLLDSLNKRIQFLQTVCEKLNLSKVECIHGRAEDFGRNPSYRENYDLCVSRAVANLSTLSEYCTPFVRVGGKFVSYKADQVEDEVEQAKEAIRKLHCEMDGIEKVQLHGSELTRSFVKIYKKGKLNPKYPRKAGLPAKNPLS